MSAESSAPKKCITAGCIILSGARVLLMKHRKLGIWLPPGGHVEPNEFPTEAAIREAREETGIQVKLMKNGEVSFSSEIATVIESPFAVALEHVPYKTGEHIHFDLMYLATPTGGEVAASDESEDVRWFTLKEFEGIETFPNVRAVVELALRIHGGKKPTE